MCSESVESLAANIQLFFESANLSMIFLLHINGDARSEPGMTRINSGRSGGGRDYTSIGTVTVGGKVGPVSESPFEYPLT